MQGYECVCTLSLNRVMEGQAEALEGKFIDRTRHPLRHHSSESPSSSPSSRMNIALIVSPMYLVYVAYISR